MERRPPKEHYEEHICDTKNFDFNFIERLLENNSYHFLIFRLLVVKFRLHEQNLILRIFLSIRILDMSWSSAFSSSILFVLSNRTKT